MTVWTTPEGSLASLAARVSDLAALTEGGRLDRAADTSPAWAAVRYFARSAPAELLNFYAGNVDEPLLAHVALTQTFTTHGTDSVVLFDWSAESPPADRGAECQPFPWLARPDLATPVVWPDTFAPDPVPPTLADPAMVPVSNGWEAVTKYARTVNRMLRVALGARFLADSSHRDALGQPANPGQRAASQLLAQAAVLEQTAQVWLELLPTACDFYLAPLVFAAREVGDSRPIPSPVRPLSVPVSLRS